MSPLEKRKLIARRKSNFQKENKEQLKYIVDQVRKQRLESRPTQNFGTIENEEQLTLPLYPNTQQNLW